jgi:hypothetical protein
MNEFPQLTEMQLRALRRVAFAERGDRPDRDPQVRGYLVELRDLGLLAKLKTDTARGWVIGPTELGVALLREAWLGRYKVAPKVGVANPPTGG